MSLVSLSDMKDYLGLTGTEYDIFLQEQLDLFSSAVENYCGRKFNAADYVQTFYYSDYLYGNNNTLWAYHFPINSVTSIKEISESNGVDTDTTTLDAYMYRVNSKVGKVLRLCNGWPTAWFSASNTRYEVSYNAGYVDIPLEIDSTIKSLVEERYNKKANGIELGFGSDVQSVSIPGTISVSFDYSLQANERSTHFGMLLGNYVNVLDFFRSERPVVGEIRENYVS